MVGTTLSKVTQMDRKDKGTKQNRRIPFERGAPIVQISLKNPLRYIHGSSPDGP
jgi:hypothetical protein